MLDQSTLKELLVYDPDTGVFIWRERSLKWFKTPRSHSRWNTLHAGTRAICQITEHGRFRGVVLGRMIYASRAAFLYMEGWLPEQVDHINRVRTDDRWVNLRAADPVVNARNRGIRTDNTSGHVGVSFNQTRGKWYAHIGMGGVAKHLGVFDNLADAISARKSAEKEFKL